MIKILGEIPRNVVIATSGGVDSMMVAHYLSRRKNTTIACAFFDHGTSECSPAREIVRKFCETRSIHLITGKIEGERPSDHSIEEHWRNSRYSFLDRVATETGCSVITAHNLDDNIETYLWSTLHGTPKLIPYRRNSVIRPFMLNSKSQLVEWSIRHGVAWHEDSSNRNTVHMRNYVRSCVMPHALHVNPGLPKVISKKVSDKFERENSEIT